jgi:hypothetical protein
MGRAERGSAPRLQPCLNLAKVDAGCVPVHEKNSHPWLTLLSRGALTLPLMNSNETQRIDSSRPRGLRVRLLAVLLVAMLAFPALAAAESPTDDQYSGSDVSLDQQVNSDPSSGLGGSVGPLPFTGFDVIAMLAVALTVTGIGLALQRAVARESTDQL